MKKTLLLLGLLVGLAAIYFFFIFDRQDSSLCKESIEFAVQDTDIIERIAMRRVVNGEELENIILDRQTEKDWTFNGGYNALELRVETLTEAIRLLSVRRTLSDASSEKALSLLDQNHIQVEIFGKEGLIRAYQVGPQTKDFKGTVMLMTGDMPMWCDASPQVVHLPGATGYLNSRFTMEFEQWLENLIFDARKEELSSIQVDCQDVESTFSLQKQNEAWSLAGEEGEVNMAAVDAYLSLFDGKKYAESFAGKNYPTLMDSLKNRTADIVFSLEYQDGNSRKIHLYERPENLNNFFAWVEGEEQLITIQHFVFDPFLKKKNEFLVPGS
jgi:hypothetical protein